ncbi:hypothetical protein F1C16_17650 [Hymenobacter sp. NBH84]|uniref:transposase n=1 Tax=Hymenobacter sp. NBH84 TaxID=2596915 RepID=UPI001628D617|nr:transposase [Hymenobacter sp. NBH84]QNE41246.1 hypothetical protein F1C16_17650 [Hymenobacter sp. NBH84]
MNALPPGETLFVTFRLAGSLRHAIGRQLHADLQTDMELSRAGGLTDEQQQLARQRAQKRFFAQFDAELDRAEVGPTYLEKEKLAEIVAGELLMLEEQGFWALAFVVLPNHVHAVLHLPAGSGLSIYKSLKLLHQRTATQCRRHLRHQLPPEADFWQIGSYEYPVQDADELTRILAYVQHHAQRLRLPPRFHDWPYVYEMVKW